jgi:hypothetical protein
MARFASHECRWFFEGPPPEEVVRWFVEARPWKRREPVEPLGWPRDWRVDRYLVLPGQTDLGIKWRDESAPGATPLLELKGRTAEIGTVELAPSVVGRVEEWVKWSFPADSAPASLHAVFAEEAAVVRKKRLLRWIHLDAFHGDVEVSLHEPPAGSGRGMRVELTRVGRDDEAHWSLGIEAFPCDDGIHEGVLRNSARFLDEYPGTPPLTAARSLSYPAWLALPG